MTNSFLLLVFPMRSLTIHLGGYRDCLGLSLRGSCTTAADATHLEQAVEQLLTKGVAQAWVDCQRLHSLNAVGERALLHAASSAQAINTVLYWCGLPPAIVQQLVASGLDTVLELRSAAEFQGPQFLLPRVVAA